MGFLKKNFNIIIGAVIVLVVAVAFYMYYASPSEKFEGKDSSPAPSSSPPAPQSPHSPQSSELPTIVLFHAGYCGACKSMMGEWDRFESMINSSQTPPPFKVLKLEYESNKDLMNNLNIDGFPTIRKYAGTFPNGPFVPFNSQRTAENFMNFARS